MPGRNTRSPVTPSGTRMRTGRRCTILVKLPVALSAGSSENTEPEAGATLATVPSIARPGGQRVARDPPPRAGLEAGELRLLQIRVDIALVERDEAREPLTGLHE